MARHLYITIEGPIAVGKTTLARLIREEFQAELLLEVFEENPFLSDFYADREKYAFQTQIFFLLSRYQQQHKVVSKILQSSPLISDYAFVKDRLFAHLNLRNDELATYERLHTALAENIVPPDLVVYLRAETQTLMDRIAIRDRPYERQMSWQYMDDLRRAYEEFFREYAQTPVLALGTDDLDIVHNPEDLAKVVHRIRAILGEGTYQRSFPQMEATPLEAEVGVVESPGRRLCDFQRWHRAQDGKQDVFTSLYFDFIRLQGEMGTVARELAEIWVKQMALYDAVGNQAESLERATQERRAPLRDGLATCLAHLLKLANHTGVDLEEAYLQKMRAEHKRPVR